MTATLAATSASQALQGRTECVQFEWHESANSTRGAISVPVVVNGTTVRWQLDTGADVNMSYGASSDRAGWTTPDKNRFGVDRLSIGSTTIYDSLVFVRREMAGEGQVTGTLGLNSIVGKIAVIDYPGRRFCLFAEGKLPDPFWSFPFSPTILRDRKVLLPMKLGAFESDAILFDTGSSEVPLNVDEPTWRQLTGKPGVEAAEAKISGTAWGKPIMLYGAPSTAPMRIGSTDIGRPLIYTERTADTFAERAYKIDGIVGNAPFWNGIVVLDLTVRTRFGYQPE